MAETENWRKTRKTLVTPPRHCVSAGKMHLLTVFVIFFLCIVFVDAFRPLAPRGRPTLTKISMTLGPPSFLGHHDGTTTSLALSLLQAASADQARIEFYFFFFAGSGALGLGLGQVPKILKEYEAVAALKGLGESKGGELLSLNPIAGFGYPDQVCRADVLDIIATMPSVETMLANASKSGRKLSYMEQTGFLGRQTFTDSYPAKTNKLALYMVFDALTGGSSSNVVSPVKVKELSAEWKAEPEEGLSVFESALTKTQTAKLASFGSLAFLVGLVIDLVVESGAKAFL